MDRPIAILSANCHHVEETKDRWKGNLTSLFLNALLQRRDWSCLPSSIIDSLFWARPWNLWPAEAKQRMVNLHPWGQSKCLIAGGKPVCCWHSGKLPGPSIANNTHCCEADGWRGWRRYGEIWCSCGDWVRSLPPKRTTLKCHIERWCSAPSPGSKRLSMTEDGRRLQSRRWSAESRKRPRQIPLPMILCLFNTVKEWLAVSAQDGYWAVHR